MAVASADTTKLIIELETVLRGLRATLRGLEQTEAKLKSLTRLEKQLNTLGGAALRVGGGLRSLGLTASVALTGPLAALATLATRNAVEFDSLRRGLTVMAGSAEEAGRQLERLKEIAKAPGIGFQEAIQGSIRLQAVGFSAEQAEKALVQFANAVALTGGGRDELERITVQLGQLAAKGKVVAQDLKPIIEAGPAVGQALLEAFGTVNSEDIQKLGLSTDEFFERLIKALSNLPRAAAGAKNAFENFSDSMFRASLALGDAILPVLTKIAEFLEPIVQRLSEGFRSLPQSVQVAIVAIGALAAALGPVLFLAGGVISGLGALATALAALLPILGSIGLPAILAVLGGLATVVAEITVVITALGLAWRSNFLGIRQIVTNAANAVLTAFNRIRAVFDEAIRRILPTLQSITTKVLGAVQAVWERYGKVVVQVVGDAFRFVTDVTVTFLKLFTDFVDLVLKLIDGDWQGAWRAFARIIITQLDRIGPLIVRFERGVRRALLSLTVFIIRQAVAFADAGSRLAVSFITALAVGLIAGFPKIQNALATVLLLAAVGIPLGPIAQALIARLIAELRKAAGEEAPLEAPVITAPGETPATPRKRFKPRPAEEDDKALRRQLDRLREARDKFAEVQEESQIDLLRSRIESEFEATKAGLDRELTVLEQNFDDRLVALRKYLTERKSLEESQIDAEIAKELELTSVLFQELNARSRAAVREFETERAEIDRDPKLKGAARQAAIETAEIKKATEFQKAQAEFRVKNAESIARVVQLEKDRKALAEELLRLERIITEEIAKQQAQIGFDLLEEQGRTADAEAGRLKARFTETLRDLRIDITGLGADLQDALNKVNLSELQNRLDGLPQPIRTMVELLDIGIKRAQILEAQRLVDDLSAGLRLDEERIQNRVLDGLLTQRQAQAAILLIQQQYRGVLLDVLKGELAKAEAIKDQGLITAIRGQIAEVERLGIEIDEVGQQINRALFQDLQSGLSGIFSGARKGFEGLKDAAISFGERLLDTLNDIAATSVLKQIEGIFKPDATNTKGTVGGFFAKLFGLGPDKSQAAATAAATTLQTGATTAAATFTTGTATASATFSTSVVTAATSFASAVIAAGAAFAAAVGAAGIAQGAGGGLGSLLGGAAAEGGLFAAVPGGAIRILEGGYPEAVLTTDPRHASRQMEILRAYLAETKGLYGRIKGFAAGAFITPDITSGISRAPMPQLNVGELAVTHAPSMMRLRQILVDERDIGNWVNSPEGERVMVDFLNKNQPVIRKLSGR